MLHFLSVGFAAMYTCVFLAQGVERSFMIAVDHWLGRTASTVSASELALQLRCVALSKPVVGLGSGEDFSMTLFFLR